MPLSRMKSSWHFCRKIVQKKKSKRSLKSIKIFFFFYPAEILDAGVEGNQEFFFYLPYPDDHSNQYQSSLLQVGEYLYTQMRRASLTYSWLNPMHKIQPKSKRQWLKDVLSWCGFVTHTSTLSALSHTPNSI